MSLCIHGLQRLLGKKELKCKVFITTFVQVLIGVVVMALILLRLVFLKAKQLGIINRANKLLGIGLGDLCLNVRNFVHTVKKTIIHCVNFTT